MGDRLTEEERETRQASPTPYGDIFDELLPHYMAMGMTYADYWDGEIGMKTAYRRAFRIRMENEARIADRDNWYMGQYIISALNSVVLVVPGVNAKPGVTMPDYIEKPIMEIAEEKKKAEVKKQHEEDQMKLAMAMFQAGIAKFNARFEKEHAKDSHTGQYE